MLTKPRFRTFLRRAVACLLLGAAVSLSAACESSSERHVRRMMWYRQPPSQPPNSHTLTVGRYGRDAEYGRWPGFSVSGEGTETGGTDTGRYGETATYATWGPTDVGGQPVPNSNVSARSGLAGTTLGVQGGTMTVGEWNDGPATFGTLP